MATTAGNDRIIRCSMFKKYLNSDQVQRDWVFPIRMNYPAASSGVSKTDLSYLIVASDGVLNPRFAINSNRLGTVIYTDFFPIRNLHYLPCPDNGDIFKAHALFLVKFQRGRMKVLFRQPHCTQSFLANKLLVGLKLS
jgi:hypothetical protein